MTNEAAERLLTEHSQFWAHVEVVGRREHWGRVTVESIGGAAFFRVDTPDKPPVTERRRGFYRAEGDPETGANPYGACDVTEGPVPAQTVLIGTGSIYSITPMPEEIVRREAFKRVAGEVVRVVRVEEVKAELPAAPGDMLDAAAGYEPDEDDDQEDDEEEELPF